MGCPWLPSINPCDSISYNPCNSMFNINPLYSMGGWQTPMTNSIFNCGSGLDYSMMSNPYGMWPSFTGNGTDDYINQMKKYQDFAFDNNLEQGKRTKEADLKVNAPVRRLQNSISELQTLVNGNEQELIMPAFEKVKESVKALYPDETDEKTIINEALAAYKAQNKDPNGREESLIEHIKRTGHDSLLHGLYQGATLGLLTDNRTAAENVSALTGLPVSKTEKAKKAVGNAAGAAVFGAGAVLTLKGIGNLFGRKLKWIPKTGKIALVAGLAGGIYGLVTGLNSK